MGQRDDPLATALRAGAVEILARHDMQMCPGRRAAQRGRGLHQVQVFAAQAERLADPQPREPQQHQQEAVTPTGRGLQQRLPLLLGGGAITTVALGAQLVPRPHAVAQPAVLGAQLGRQVPVVADLVEGGQHPRVQACVGDLVLDELAHDREHMVDPTGAARATVAAPAAGDRRRA